MRGPAISPVAFSNEVAKYVTPTETPFSRCCTTQKECIPEIFIKTLNPLPFQVQAIDSMDLQ